MHKFQSIHIVHYPTPYYSIWTYQRNEHVCHISTCM